MAVLVVEQGAGVAVRATALVTDMGLDDLAVAPLAADFGDVAGIESLLLHQGEVQA